jgi:hypothetical protein
VTRSSSTFFPEWINGSPLVEGFVSVLGDGIDGYARERDGKTIVHPRAYWLQPCWKRRPFHRRPAWRALMADVLKPGDVLVKGAGSVSIFALQFAKMAGATVVPLPLQATKKT